MAGFVHLPLDVVDRILDICADALPDALRSCSLVCRELRPLAQAKIFNVVKISTHVCANDLVHLMNSNPQLASYINDVWLDMGPLVSEEYFIDEETTSLMVSLNVLASHPLKFTISGWDDGDLRAIGWPRGISPYPTAFSRIASLDLLSLKHIPVNLFKAMPQIESLSLADVTFYPRLETLTSGEMEEIFGSCFYSLKKLIIEEMNVVYGIIIASCPALEDLQLFHINHLVGVSWFPGRILPAPKYMDIAFGNINHGVMRTLVDSVIDVRRLQSLSDLTAETKDHGSWDFEDAIHAKESLDYILRRCNYPNSALRTLSLSFFGYGYPTSVADVGIDISSLTTVTFLSMRFFCLKPADDRNVLLHIRDILRTIPRNSKLKTISITFTVALSVITVLEDDTILIDYLSSSRVSRSSLWTEIRSILNAAFGVLLGGENLGTREVEFYLDPVCVSDNARGFTQIKVHEDDLWRGIGGYIPRRGWKFPYIQ